MKKILTLVIATLLLTACEPPQEITRDVLTISGGMIAANTMNQEIEAIIGVQRPIYYYEEIIWDYCVIDNVRYENITFRWTELGMAIVSGERIRFIPNIAERITECEGRIIQHEGE